MNKTWFFFRKVEGHGYFTGRRFSGEDIFLEVNTPHECEAIEGSFDHQSQRVDLATRDALFEQAKAEWPAKVQAARDAHEQRVLALRAEHESRMQQRAAMIQAQIEDGIANNRPRPRPFVPTDFVEPVFVEPTFDEQGELQRATLAAVVDYQPPTPSPEHEWNPESKRWQLTPAAAARNAADAAARSELAAIDAKLVRYLAEISAGTIDEEGRQRFDAMMARKEELRGDLKP